MLMAATVCWLSCTGNTPVFCPSHGQLGSDLLPIEPPYVDNTPDDGWTNSFADIQCYDMTHVVAVLNQIDGWTHDHSQRVGVPTLFGTNFQSVSVGEKLLIDPVTGALGGCTDVVGTPGAGLSSELAFVDHALGLFVAELKKEGLYDSTLIIVGAQAVQHEQIKALPFLLGDNDNH